MIDSLGTCSKSIQGYFGGDLDTIYKEICKISIMVILGLAQRPHVNGQVGKVITCGSSSNNVLRYGVRLLAKPGAVDSRPFNMLNLALWLVDPSICSSDIQRALCALCAVLVNY